MNWIVQSNFTCCERLRPRFRVALFAVLLLTLVEASADASIANPLETDYPVKIDQVGIRFQRSRSNQITNTYLVMSFVVKNTSANPICEIMGTAWVQAPSQQRSQLGGYFEPLQPGKSHGFDVSLFLDEKDDPDVVLLHTKPSQIHLHWNTELVKLCNGLVYGMGRR